MLQSLHGVLICSLITERVVRDDSSPNEVCFLFYIIFPLSLDFLSCGFFELIELTSLDDECIGYCKFYICEKREKV